MALPSSAAHASALSFFLAFVLLEALPLNSAGGAAKDSPHLSVHPATIRWGDWVTVSFGGVPQSEFLRSTSEYICKQDADCEDVQNMSLWVGLFPASSDRKAIGPQDWPTGSEPWLATSPIAWKPLTSQSGEASFKVEVAFAPALEFSLFSNGTTWSIELARSDALLVSDVHKPQHLRLARVHSADSMRVSWTSSLRDEAATVLWGSAPGSFMESRIAEVSTYFKDHLCGPPATEHGWSEPGWLYSAVIGPLVPSHGYSMFYIVGSDAMGWSENRNFSVPTPPGASENLRFIALADMGVSYVDGAQYHWIEPFAINSSAFALDQEARRAEPGSGQGRVLDAVREAVQTSSKGFELVLHVGDLSYATGYASKWDHFMSQIEPLSSRVPYMTAQGNHERDWPNSGSAIGGSDSGGECGVPTQARFRMPVPVRNQTQDQGWYSFEQGPVHFVMMNTEMSAYQGSAQYDFLVSDMAAVDRSKTPWVIFSGHRPMYSSSQALHAPNSSTASYDLEDGPWWPEVEELLVKYQVDLCLWGHVHNAEQTCPLARGRCVAAAGPGGYDAPVHAVIGNAGQSLSPFCLPDRPYCCCSALPPLCADACKALPPWSVWRMDSFGYSVIEVEGSTGLTMNFYQDCVGERDGGTMWSCTEFNKLVHSFTIRRRADLRGSFV